MEVRSYSCCQYLAPGGPSTFSNALLRVSDSWAIWEQTEPEERSYGPDWGGKGKEIWTSDFSLALGSHLALRCHWLWAPLASSHLFAAVA